VFGRGLFDIFVVIYALSLVFFFVDAIEPRRRFNRAGVLLLFVVFCLETLFFLYRLWSSGTLPVYTPFDVSWLISWLILTIVLVVNAFFPIGLFLFFANVVAFAIVALDAFGFQGHVVYTARQGDLLVLHIVFGLASYVAFCFSFVFSLMYLAQNWMLRKKRWNHWFFQMPPLAKLEKYSFGSVLVGLPLLLISIVLGSIWGELTLGQFLLTDPKLLTTVGLWMMYGFFLFLRNRPGFGTRRLVWYNLVCFLGTILNFLVINGFSLVHHGI
jgi:HemX protein